MEKNTRITKAQRFADIVAMLNGNPAPNGSSVEDIKDFCAHEVELLSKKNTAADKRKAEARAKDDVVRAIVVDFLAKQKNGVQVSDIIHSVVECNLFSTSKVTSLLRPLLANGKVVRYEEKGKALYRLGK